MTLIKLVFIGDATRCYHCSRWMLEKVHTYVGPTVKHPTMSATTVDALI